MNDTIQTNRQLTVRDRQTDRRTRRHATTYQ